MKTRHLLSLAAICTVALATAAMRGGCAPDPCPDLYIACPDLDCPEGFQVDKSGCAICACTGEQPETCLADADCAAGFICAFDDLMPVGDTRCLGGADGERCGAELVGQCVPAPRPECFSDADCAADEFCAWLGVEPMGCAVEEGGGELDCLPPAGVCLPREQPGPCEQLDEWSCIEDPRCAPLYETARCECIDCFCADQEMFVGCVEVGPEPACFSDADCAEGAFCSLPLVDCLEGELDCGMLPGICLPREEPAPCEELDELSCQETPGCLPIYEAVDCGCLECDCAEMQVFTGCVEEIVGCWGAWIDQNGNCRAPNDGAYPDACCYDEVALPGQP